MLSLRSEPPWDVVRHNEWFQEMEKMVGIWD
jgi:hypothetical protein